MSTRSDAACAAARRLRDEPLLRFAGRFGPRVEQGIGDGARLLIGDQSEIALFPPDHASSLDHRMALLARPGDTVVTRQPAPRFAAYAQDWLGLGDVAFLSVGAGRPRPVAALCHGDAQMRNRIAARIAGRGTPAILPYLTTGHDWRLAQVLAEAADRPVAVAGPTPLMSRRANDKLWFAALARDVLGRDAVPPSAAAFGPAAAAGLVARMARSADSVVVKVPDSAGSSGNIRLETAALAGLAPAGIRRLLLDRLAALGWQGRFPLQIGVWETGVRCSPSVQIWIPAKGPPRLDGVMEQRVLGVEGAFIGGTRAELEPALQERLATEGLALADALQRMGYVGQCSLDAILRDGGGPPELHWIECNARWGGMSIPLAVATRLAGGAAPAGFVVTQAIRPELPLIGMDAMVARLRGLLWRDGDPATGIVVLSPPDARNGLRVNLMAMDRTAGAARALMRRAWARFDPA
ncbi:preATP grasp domain-containing protein [Jannaschia ovalis]|uniref:Pre ATP-grasp domain-containing protein n=1 Tax=Jannaschia ovalis TaxID=3038773 RepID=A0ABY8LAW0_9RHOB|nr:hypothetical protein [Jannaschia sp. GRR-S6-38]WGH77180.1 hypothetical protein P8627_08910 [Jannaschia sp. GRR-S6-38]